MGQGRHNFFVLKLTNQDQITGGGSEADVTGHHAVLDIRAQLVGARVSADAISSGGTAVIKAYYGASKSGTAATGTASLTPTTLKGDLSIVDENIIYAAGSEFCMSENTTNTKTIDGLAIDLYFRSMEK